MRITGSVSGDMWSAPALYIVKLRLSMPRLQFPIVGFGCWATKCQSLGNRNWFGHQVSHIFEPCVWFFPGLLSMYFLFFPLFLHFSFVVVAASPFRGVESGIKDMHI